MSLEHHKSVARDCFIIKVLCNKHVNGVLKPILYFGLNVCLNIEKNNYSALQQISAIFI